MFCIALGLHLLQGKLLFRGLSARRLLTLLRKALVFGWTLRRVFRLRPCWLEDRDVGTLSEDAFFVGFQLHDEANIWLRNRPLPLQVIQCRSQVKAPVFHHVTKSNGGGAALASEAVHQNFSPDCAALLNEGVCLLKVRHNVLHRIVQQGKNFVLKNAGEPLSALGSARQDVRNSVRNQFLLVESGAHASLEEEHILLAHFLGSRLRTQSQSAVLTRCKHRRGH